MLGSASLCPVAVPEILFTTVKNFDRGHSLSSLHLPLAALASLPTSVSLRVYTVKNRISF